MMDDLDPDDIDDIDAAWAYHEQLERRAREDEALKRHAQVLTEFRRWLEDEQLIPKRHIQEREMAKVTAMIQSKFLRKEDFDEDQVLTIKDCRQENVGREDDNEQRWVLYFRERDKGMVLNVTTIRVLEQAYGGDSDDWIGKKVQVYVDPNVSFGGKIVGGLRLRTPRKAATPKPAPAPADDEFNDSIPF